MAFATCKQTWKKIRVPGRAIPEEKCREGILGKLDRMSLSEYKKKTPFERSKLMDEAFREKLGSNKAAA